VASVSDRVKPEYGRREGRARHGAAVGARLALRCYPRDSRTAGRHEWACFASQQAAEKALKALHLACNQEAWGRVVAQLLAELPGIAVPDPVAGASWEGYAIENLCAAAPRGTAAWFYRSAAGAEIDLVLEVPGAGTLAIEIKRLLAPALSKGFVIGCEDVRAARRYLVYPGVEAYALDRRTSALPLGALVAELAQRR